MKNITSKFRIIHSPLTVVTQLQRVLKNYHHLFSSSRCWQDRYRSKEKIGRKQWRLFLSKTEFKLFIVIILKALYITLTQNGPNIVFKCCFVLSVEECLTCFLVLMVFDECLAVSVCVWVTVVSYIAFAGCYCVSLIIVLTE